MNGKIIAVPSSNLEGNITSCEIKTAEIKVIRKSLFSFSEKREYKSYDVCTRETIENYQVPSITAFGAFSIIFLVVIIFFAFMCWLED